MNLYPTVRSLLLKMDAERAHTLALRTLGMLDTLHLSGLATDKPKPFPTKALGLTFPNPVGLAAGLDKDGEYLNTLFAMGFGFVEIGTITPKPQPGNPKPRLFRLPENQGLINRMGFNSGGVDAAVANLEHFKKDEGILGINIGKNKHTENAAAYLDYVFCMERVYPYADYITINISSPNTAGLRELQEEIALRQLISELHEKREQLSVRYQKHVPLLVKIAPDLSEQDIDSLARVLSELRIDGVIATNTTVQRDSLKTEAYIDEQGGLSGAPLQTRSTAVLRMLRTRLPDSIPLIGVGGIMTGADAAQKTAAGAQLVQLYSGLIYTGPTLINKCVEAIRRRKEAPSAGHMTHMR